LVCRDAARRSQRASDGTSRQHSGGAARCDAGIGRGLAVGSGDTASARGLGRAGAGAGRRGPVESRPGTNARRTNGSQRAHARPASSGGGADSFQEELALLARAERAIRAGNATLARSFVAELEARFPKTALRQERAALLVLAACATGEPAAQTDAREFLGDHEQSVYVDRIRSMCELDRSAPQTSAPK